MPPRIRGRLHEAARRLMAAQAAGDLDEGHLEAELLYGEAAGLDRAQVIAAGAEVPEPETLARFGALLERRLGHEPLAYILGRREFYGLTFAVGPGVLVPRPETETLVEATLAAVHEHPGARRVVRAADVGTGCGAVALAVAKHAPNAKLFATEASSEALAYAGRNRKRFGLVERVVFLTGDLLEPVGEPLDVVAANLPYVPAWEFEALPAVIREHEPALAVDGGEDGLALFQRLFRQLPQHLAEGPHAVLLEVGAGQATIVSELLVAAIGGEPRTHRDLLGIRRVVEVRVGY